jgi:hypothetical protein
MVLSALLCAALSSAPGSFPIQGEKGQVLDPKATTFHVPHQLSQVEHFYRDQFSGEKEITFVKDQGEKGTTLTIRSKRKGDTWTKAVLTDEGVTTSITVTTVLKMDEAKVGGNGPPLAVIIPRSGEVQKTLKEIDASHEPEH